MKLTSVSRRLTVDGGHVATNTGVHHAALTVSDADAVRFRVLAHPESGCIVGVRQDASPAGDRFDEFRTGLDHLAFADSSRSELEGWERELSAIGSAIVFRDPDNIQLEFLALRITSNPGRSGI